MANHWENQAVSAAEAVSHIRSGMKIFIHGAAATPTPLLDALANSSVEDIETHHIHLDGHLAITDPGMEERFHPVAYFIGPNMRGHINEGRA